MDQFKLYVFGPPRLEKNSTPVQLRGRKVWALLAYLAVTGSTHSRDHLAALLWPDHSQSRARANFRRELSVLNKTLGESRLLIATDQISLSGERGIWLDVADFQARLAECRTHTHAPHESCARCLPLVQMAVGLYTGDFLAGFSLSDSPMFDEWQRFQTESLRQDLSGALDRLIDAHRAQSQLEPAIVHARRRLSLDPLHEPAQRALMQLYASAGDRTAALHQYRECVRILAAELGVEPATETTDLYERTKRNEVTISDSEQASSSHLVTSNLPAQATPFIGRRRQLEEIAERLADEECRLLTIVGPGGMGKTRLAIQAALAQADSFQHGVHLVDLAPVGSADLLAITMLRSLEAPQLGAADPPQRLCDYLQQKEMLLLLDSFEHLLADTQRENTVQQANVAQHPDHPIGGVDLLLQILHAAPDIKLMVTSRERLNLREEWLLPLLGLETPPIAVPAHGPDPVYREQDGPAPDLQAYDATRLFVLCMRRLHTKDKAETGAAMAAEECTAIAAICRLLEGMPLGIELAVAWTRALPLVEIQGEMERSLHFLSAPLRDLPACDWSMYAVFDHSWNLLSQHERSILRRMSVFRGGCTRQAAEEVTDAALADLAGLVDRSWLRQHSIGRYDMHELMRQYCEEKLEAEHAASCGETAAQVRKRHCTYFGAYLHDAVQKMNFRREALHEIMREFGNTQAAWRCAIDTLDVPTASDICLAIYFAGDMMGWFRFSIQTLETGAIRLAKQLAEGGSATANRDGIIQVLANIRHAQSDMYTTMGQLEGALTNAEWLCRLVERMEPGKDHDFWHMMGRKTKLWILFESGDFDAACCLAQELLDYFEDENFGYLVYGDEVGRSFWQAGAYAAQGKAIWALGDYAEAVWMYERCMALHDEVGEQRFKGFNLEGYARLIQTMGDFNQAEELARQGLRLSEGVGDRIGAAHGHLAVGRVLAAQGHHDRAQVHLAQSRDMGRESGRLILLMDSLVELGLSRLGQGRPDQAIRLFDQALQAFTAVGTSHTNSLVAVWLGLGWSALAEKDLAQAGTMFRKALSARGRIALETMDGIAGMGQVLMMVGRYEEAVALFALVENHPFTGHALRLQAVPWLHNLEHVLPLRAYNQQVAAGHRSPLDEVVDSLRAAE